MQAHIPLLIVGAGPYGLAMSAYARGHNIDHVVVGQAMDFWKSHMPKGMFLRSGYDWHYDPFNEDTIERYLEAKNLKPADVEPLPLDFYLGYTEWFRQRKGIEVSPWWVEQLSYLDGARPAFEVVLQDGRTIRASNVVLALGFRYFKNVPEAYRAWFPPARFAHTGDLVDLSSLKGKRVLILGGRQSAFEWAALAREQGAGAVYLAYRHPTPSFQAADWTWVNPIVDSMVSDPGWFRRLTSKEKELVSYRLWAEGRLKLEPWLAARINNEQIKLLPHTQVTAGKQLSSGELEVALNGGATLRVDQVILATGYKVNLGQVPFLARGNVLSRLVSSNGFPSLDLRFQSNLPGLFFTSMAATQDFGPFFGFTVGVRTSASVIGSALHPRPN